MEPPQKPMSRMDQTQIAETGYTAHLSGMYSDKFIHPKVQTDAGRYITIGCVDGVLQDGATRRGRERGVALCVDAGRRR